MSDSETTYNLMPGTEGIALSATLPKGTSQFVDVNVTAKRALWATHAKGTANTAKQSADAAGDTSTLTATVWRGGELLSGQDVARMGLLACAAGTAVECRLEA